MHRIRKRSYRDKFRTTFYHFHVHPWYKRIMVLPFGVRVCLAVCLFLFGIVGLVTPIPAGWVMILMSGALVFGIHSVRRSTVRIFFMLRLHRASEWIHRKLKK